MFFYTFMPKLFNMSLTASVAIALVILLRLLLKKAPKVISYALWGVVLFRLLCPVSIRYNIFSPSSIWRAIRPDFVGSSCGSHSMISHRRLSSDSTPRPDRRILTSGGQVPSVLVSSTTWIGSRQTNQPSGFSSK